MVVTAQLVFVAALFTADRKPAVAKPATPAPAAAPATKPAEPTRTRGQLQAARQFAFEDVSLGTTLEAFQEKYPAAELSEAESKPEVGVKAFRVQELDSADGAEYLFLDDNLYQVTVFYSPERLKEMGGDTIPLKKLVQKLGKQDKNSPGIVRRDGEEQFIARWSFPEAGRRFTLVAHEKSTAISFTDTQKSSLVIKRTDLGF